jgi:hypothetical protein
MIIRATTKEELREVLNYMCTTKTDTGKSGFATYGASPPYGVRYGKRCGGDFPSHRTM